MESSLIRANYSPLSFGAGLPRVLSVNNHSTVRKIEHHMNMLGDLFQRESDNPWDDSFGLPLCQITPCGEKLRRENYFSLAIPIPVTRT
jgi:hypothetical protein